MPDNAILSLWGFEIKRSKKPKNEDENQKSIVPPVDEDGGAGYSTVSGSRFGHYLNIGDTDTQNTAALIRQYRGAAAHPEVDDAIENIISQAISTNENEKSVKIVTDNVKSSTGVKKKIAEEFDEILNMLKFEEYGYDIFRRWYVDGKLFHHLVVKEGSESQGIQEIRPIDAAKIHKIREVEEKIDPKTGVKLIDKVVEYFVFQEKIGNAQSTVRLTPDSISYITSGLLNEERNAVVSYLHKAMKPINQLRMLEDSLVIYRLARAPERRIFYIDVGNLPKQKAEEYMKNIMTKYRNKIVYDSTTGDLKDDRKHMSMLEDFWLPRREGGRGTEITTLPGGENLSQIDDIIYFQRRLFKSLNVPVSRIDTEGAGPFQFGRSTEISREEVQFQKFIDRLRRRFSNLFLGILKKQLILKNIITEEDWEELSQALIVDFSRDNFFSEMKDIEIMRERVETLERMRELVGVYYSKEWVMKNILKMDDSEIKSEKKKIEKERAEAPPEEGMDGGGFGMEPEPRTGAVGAGGAEFAGNGGGATPNDMNG